MTAKLNRRAYCYQFLFIPFNNLWTENNKAVVVVVVAVAVIPLAGQDT